MTHDDHAAGSTSASEELCRSFRSASAVERAALLVRCLKADPNGRLDLGSVPGQHIDLGGIDLSKAAVAALCSEIVPSPTHWDPVRSKLCLADANLAGANLRGANLEGCDLMRANLQDVLLGDANLAGVNLEGANLKCADLAGSVLREANLGGADLRSALLEEADLSSATLRFADLSDAILERVSLVRADLWGAVLDRATMVNADLGGAVLREASLQQTDLTGARLTGIDAGMACMRGAVLRHADLRGATLAGTSLDNAMLQGAKLQELDLSSCTLAHVHLGGAWLAGTRLEREQLGDTLGEETTREYGDARKGYLGLEQNFENAGDPDSASWAYKRRRRMQKLEARVKAQRALRVGKLAAAVRHSGRYVADLGAEWLCDYGESIPRVLTTMATVYFGFCLIYGLTGSLVRTGPTEAGTIVKISDVLDLAVFSLLAMTTSGTPAIGLLPRTEAVHLLTGLEALCGIFLTGLLGFVVGNRIRR